MVYGATFLFIPLIWVMLNRGSLPVVEMPWGGSMVDISSLDLVLFTLSIGMMIYLFIDGFKETKEQREKGIEGMKKHEGFHETLLNTWLQTASASYVPRPGRVIEPPGLELKMDD